MDQTSLSPRYVQNPDVVLREEDQDGALLFNPDTNQIKVLNATGLFIWQQCDGAHVLSDIVASIKDAFDEVPEGQIGQDTQHFVDELQQCGFIGITDRLG